MKLNIIQFTKGRVNRELFILGKLFLLLILFCLSLPFRFFDFSPFVNYLLIAPQVFFVFVFYFSLGVRRLHDFNFSGWWLLLLPPLIPLFLIVLLCKKGNKGENRYGKPIEKNVKFFEFSRWNVIVEAKGENLIPILIIICFVIFATSVIDDEEFVTGRSSGETVKVDNEKSVIEQDSSETVKVKDGVVRDWYENGNLHLEEYYKDGKLNGTTRIYYEDGSIFNEVNYLNGKEDGVSKSWDRNNILREERVYKNSILLSLKRFDENKKIVLHVKGKNEIEEFLLRESAENLKQLELIENIAGLETAGKSIKERMEQLEVWFFSEEGLEFLKKVEG